MEFKSQFKKIFQKQKIINFKKLLIYNYAQISHSVLFWIISTVCLISQPICCIVINTISSIEVSGLFIFLIPLIFYAILELFLTIKLFSENRNNYIDTDLFSKSFTRSELFLTRVTIMFIPIFIGNFSSLLFSIVYYCIVDMSRFIVVILISNLFITPFLLFLILMLLILLSVKLKPVYCSLTSVLMIGLLLSPSLFTRELLNNDELTIAYNSNDSFDKFNTKNGIVYGINVSDSTYNENFLWSINEDNWVDYLIPSEWFISFYSSLANDYIMDMHSGDKLNYSYSLSRARLEEVNIENKDYYEVYRGQDEILPINETKFINVILSNLSEITKDSIINLKDDLVVSGLLNSLQNNLIWNNDTFSSKELDAIKAITGINTKFNQLFYLIKYHNTYQQYDTLLFKAINENFSLATEQLFRFILSDNYSIQYNIFNSKDVLSTGKTINDIYPSNYIVNNDAPILNSDYLFIRDKLIYFRDSSWYYLSNSGQYVKSNNIESSKLFKDNNIVDENSWKKYVEETSMQYSKTNNLLAQLKEIESNIIKFNLEANYSDIYKYDYIVKIRETDFLYFSPIMITTLSLLVPLTYVISYKQFNKSDYQDL